MLTFVGDLYLDHINLKINPGVIDLLKKSEIICCNFECAIDTNKGKVRKDKASILKTDEKHIKAYLDILPVKHIFGMANNHIHDLGEDGLVNTITLLKNHPGIISSGAGVYTEVARPLLISADQKKVALIFLSTDDPDVMSILATEKKSGVLDYEDPLVIDIIAQARKIADYIVLVPHWGREYISYPSFHLRKLAQRWIDAGADLIVGHHAHIIQGKEKYKGKWIYYSLGNYIFPNFYTKNDYLFRWSEENCHSISLRISFKEDIEIEEYGLFFNTFSNELTESQESIALLNKRSIVLNYETTDKKTYFGIWQREYFERLKFEYSLLRRIKSILFARYKDISFIGHYYKKIFRHVSGGKL